MLPPRAWPALYREQAIQFGEPIARLASEWQTPALAAISLRLRSQAPCASHSSEITFRTASSPVVKPAANAGGNGPVAACSRRRRIEARLSGDRCSEDRWMKYRFGAVAVLRDRATG